MRGFLDTFENILLKLLYFFCILFLSIQLILITYMVIGRYIFSKVPGWVEESALFFMVWFSLLSIAIGILEDQHIQMEVIDFLVSKRLLKIIKVVCLSLLICFGIVMFIIGIQQVQFMQRTILSGIRISAAWLHASIPISGLCIFITSGLRLRRELWER